MTKTLDADQILQHAAPLQSQRAHEIQPSGHIVKMPIAMGESVCEESVENLNQLLADTKHSEMLDFHLGTPAMTPVETSTGRASGRCARQSQ